MKLIPMALSAVLLLTSQWTLGAETPQDSEQQKSQQWAQQLWVSLDRQQGEIKLPNGVATLQVPVDFYYLSPEDSEKVLVDVWGNPPGAGKKTLGMLFPSAATPFDKDAWAVTVEYEEDGYVSDEDAQNLDYQALLSQMQEGVQAASRQRVEQGYESIELIGWASTPFYDKEAHKLHWAKEIKFGDQPVNTLNYNIRVLGRKGVLVLNFIAAMDQKELIDSKLQAVLALADFDDGSRYEDFDPSIDKVAAYGIGALVAGKVIAKTGLLAAALIFLKKFGVFVLIAAGALIGKIFKRGKA